MQPRFRSNPFPMQNINRTPQVTIAKNEYSTTVEDSGKYNSTKDYIRLSSNSIPSSQNLIKESGIPFGIHFTPFPHSVPELPVFSLGNRPIPKCRTCGVFINPYVMAEGTSWECNFCHNSNTEEYSLTEHIINIQKAGGSYEFFANTDCMDSPPMAPAYVILIDVSLTSIQSGMVMTVLEGLKNIITNNLFSNVERSKFAIITYDFSCVNFYKMNPKNGNVQLLSVADNEIFLPDTEDSLIFSYEDNRQYLLNLIDSLENTLTVSKAGSQPGGSDKLILAIEAGGLLLKHHGGKIIIFNSSNEWTVHVSHGIDAIPKDQVNYTSVDSKGILRKLSKNLAGDLISCDLFQIQTEKEAANILTISEIPNNTNGNFYFYKNFIYEYHRNNLMNQISKSFSSIVGWEGICNIKASGGLKISKMLTPVPNVKDETLIFPTIQSNTTYTAIFTYPQIDNTGKNASIVVELAKKIYFQIYVLYTHNEGSRRVRILNYQVPICANLGDHYQFLDIEASVALLAKNFIHTLYNTKKIENTIAEISQINFGYALSNIQYALKDKNITQKLLSQMQLYYLALLKHRICCKNEATFKLDPDLSNFLRYICLKSKVDEIICMIHPQIYDITDYIHGNDELTEDKLQHLPATRNSFTKNRVYLIDNNYVLILHFTSGGQANDLIKLFFGEDFVFETVGTEYHIESVVFSEANESYPNEILKRTQSVIEYIREKKSSFQSLLFSFESTNSENVVREGLIEDNSCPWTPYSYKEFCSRRY